MKKLLSILLVIAFAVFPQGVLAQETADIYPFEFANSDFWYSSSPQYTSKGDAKALLLMEFSTGRVLFAENELEPLPIASVTKVLSMLLFAEALDSGKITLQESVTVSENAASMGGSQVFLEPNEQMSVDDLLKSVAVASANDATLALAEHICGSEASFVALMNERAKALGCQNSNFVNTNGLPADNHYSCALDVAIITRELIRHELIFNYTGIWMDTIRNGTFGLANTNKLIRFYQGATGMKTGFTDSALYCLSGTAKRNGMHLIAVVLGSQSSNARFAAAKGMLDYGFANYSLLTPEAPALEPLAISRGKQPTVNIAAEPVSVLCEKGDTGALESVIELKESPSAPIAAGDTVGRIIWSRNGVELAAADIKAAEGVEEVSYSSVLWELFSKIFNIF